VNIEDDLNLAMKALSLLNGIGTLNGGKLTRELIGSIYREKFTFKNLLHRTARVNEVASITSVITNEFGAKKEWANDEKTCLPTWVRPPGLEPSSIMY
jgi:site-specific DNA recombinase